MLPECDTAYLAEHWPGHRIGQDGGQLAVVLPDYVLPAGFQPQVVELLLLLPPFGYPDAQLDMFWLSPSVKLHGAAPQATSDEVHLGLQWQRFSRHLAPGVWRPGLDGIQSYLALLRTMLEREARPASNAA